MLFLAIHCFILMWLISQCSTMTQSNHERKITAVGSSVLFLAPITTHTKQLIQWEFIRDIPLQVIVEYSTATGRVTVYPTYKGQVQFNPENSSLLLMNVQETDSGTYKAVIDLNDKEARKTLLKVIKPVSEPQAGSATQLSCNVSEGKVDKVAWRKDGQPVPQEHCYLLSKNALVIKLVMKSDCGLFSCNVSNEISWREASLNFTIEDKCSAITGLHPSLWPALHCSIVALALSCIAIVSFCLFLPSKMIKGQLWRALTVFQEGAVCLSSLLLLVTGFLWIEEKGPSVYLILVLSLLFLVIPVTFTIAAILAIHPPRIKKIMTKKVYRMILDFTVPGGALVIILFSIFFMEMIFQLEGQGCSQPKNLFVSMAVPAGIFFVILLSLFGWYHLKKENRKGAGSPYPEIGEN